MRVFFVAAAMAAIALTGFLGLGAARPALAQMRNDTPPPPQIPQLPDVPAPPAPKDPSSRVPPSTGLPPSLERPQTPGRPSQRAASPAVSAPKNAQLSLDDLFARLKAAPTPDAGEMVARQIEARWLASGSETIDLLMIRAIGAMKGNDQGLALDLLDSILVLKPDYAEAWNRRATIHFLKKDFGRSIADVEQTLRLEPRHFGALAGLAAMLKDMDRKKQALEVYRMVVDLYPSLESVKKDFEQLSVEVGGRSL